jgi:hypothetical protein
MFFLQCVVLTQLPVLRAELPDALLLRRQRFALSTAVLIRFIDRLTSLDDIRRAGALKM